MGELLAGEEALTQAPAINKAALEMVTGVDGDPGQPAPSQDQRHALEGVITLHLQMGELLAEEEALTQAPAINKAAVHRWLNLN